MSSYHVPVLLDEVTRCLNITPGGIYIDATFGGGGYSSHILKSLERGALCAFDKDTDSEKIAKTLSDENFQFTRCDFRDIISNVPPSLIGSIDGLVADLGISSHQIDSPDRGFSTRYDGELDMRMDQDSKLTAKELINNYSEDRLSEIFWIYGDLKNSRRIANQIVNMRKVGLISTTHQLIELLRPLAPRFKENQFFARVFQSIRIQVNDEYNSLKALLMDSTQLLKPSGRLVIVSYHSLEDRLVKRFLRSGNFDDQVNKDGYGNVIRPFKPMKNRCIKPSESEIQLNPRARSGRMRVGIKN